MFWKFCLNFVASHDAFNIAPNMFDISKYVLKNLFSTLRDGDSFDNLNNIFSWAKP